MEEFSTFMWMNLSEIPDWNDVEGCIRHLGEKGVEIYDALIRSPILRNSLRGVTVMKISVIYKHTRGGPNSWKDPKV